jgi:hypothetical protein
MNAMREVKDNINNEQVIAVDVGRKVLVMALRRIFGGA